MEHRPSHLTDHLPTANSDTDREPANPLVEIWDEELPESAGTGWQRAGDTLYSVARDSPTVPVCQRCGKNIHGTMVGCGDGTGQKFMHRDCYDAWKAEPELQLLVIDLGDSCVVRVEKGEPIHLQVKNHFHIGSNPYLATHPFPFADVRAAIDALADEPPVPRIEREIDSDGDEMYQIFAEKDCDTVTSYIIDALSQLAGKPLPVYEPVRGEWMQLNTHDWSQAKQSAGESGYSIDTFSFENVICPVKVWRYTRKGAE